MNTTNTALKVVQTNKTGLNSQEITNGAIYYVTDTKEIYVDFNNSRTCFEDIIILNTDESRSSILFTPLNKFYYTLDTNKLYLYKDGNWYHINSAGDLSNYQTLLSETNKLNADYIENGNTNKVVTQTEKTTWNNKQNELISGTSIKTINGTTVLGSGNIDTDNIFYVEYQTTLFSDIVTAYNAGKYIIAKDTIAELMDTRLLPLSDVMEYNGTIMMFYFQGMNGQMSVSSSNQWTKGDSNLVYHTANTQIGSATQPVYVSNTGTVTATTYTLEKSVPADAVFTDTTYSNLSEFVDDLGSSPTHTHSQYLTSHQDISGKADKSTTLSGYGITDAYTKTEIDGKLTGAMHFKGTVSTVSSLPSSGNIIGDMYNVESTGANYAWDGEDWDKLSENIDLSEVVMQSTEINGKALTGNITLDYSDVGALPDDTVIPQVDQTYDGTSENAQSGVAIEGKLAEYVTTNTDQDITGVKTFVGQKKIVFRQSGNSDKLGFTLFNRSNVEKGYLEFNPTGSIDGYPVMTLGNYATAESGITQVGFRRYSNVKNKEGAYNLLIPLIADAKAPFNLTTTYTHFYLPLGFTDGTTTVVTNKSGLVDLSSIISGSVTVDQTYNSASTNAQSGTAVAEAVGSKSAVIIRTWS